MKTIKKLIKRFNRLNPDYSVCLDELESYAGYYRINITEPVLGLTSCYTFETCKDFADWINGVVLD